MAKAKIKIEVQHGRGLVWWTTLSSEQKSALAYPRLKQKESNKQIADSYGITPNSIASIRNRWNKNGKHNPYELILLSHAPPPSETPSETPVSRETVPSKSDQPVPRPERTPAPIARPRSSPQRFVADPIAAPETRKYATSEKSQCQHAVDDDGRFCGFVATVQKKFGKYCTLHAHLHT